MDKTVHCLNMKKVATSKLQISSKTLLEITMFCFFNFTFSICIGIFQIILKGV